MGPHCQIYGRVEEVNITVVFLWGGLFRPGFHRWSSIRVLEESWVLFSFSPSLSIGICRCLWDRILWSHWDSQASFFCFPFRLLAVSGGPGFFFFFLFLFFPYVSPKNLSAFTQLTPLGTWPGPGQASSYNNLWSALLRHFPHTPGIHFHPPILFIPVFLLHNPHTSLGP